MIVPKKTTIKAIAVKMYLVSSNRKLPSSFKSLKKPTMSCQMLLIRLVLSLLRMLCTIATKPIALTAACSGH